VKRKQIGWYDPDGGSFCYASDASDASDASYDKYTIPVYAGDESPEGRPSISSSLDVAQETHLRSLEIRTAIVQVLENQEYFLRCLACVANREGVVDCERLLEETRVILVVLRSMRDRDNT